MKSNVCRPDGITILSEANFKENNKTSNPGAVGYQVGRSLLFSGII
jgi:hypothetical protein